METARDLACAELWQASLERSLARRGRPTRSSLELFHLQAERDLSRGDLLRESATYSQLRRSAAARRPVMTLPGAGGISALALLAATTLPGLIGGKGASAKTARITYRADAHATRISKARPTQMVAAASASTQPSTLPGTTTTSHVATAKKATSHAATPRTPEPAQPASTHAHIAAAHDVSGGAASGANVASGGAAPAAAHSVSSANTPAVHATAPKVHTTAPKVQTAPPAVHRAPAAVRTAPAVHRSAGSVHPGTTHLPASTRVPAKALSHGTTGGGAVEEVTGIGHPRTTATPTQPKAPVRPKPVTHATPVVKPHPVATTPPASRPAPAPAPVATGQYVNPLAGAHVTPERIDQGVDYSGSGPLGAIGNGKVTYVGTSGTGWPGAFVEYQLTDGADSGKYVYYAEGISPAAGLHVGQTVRAGQPIAQINAGDSSGIEIGWGSGVGTQPLAQALGQWSSGSDANSVATAAGKSFSALIAQLGGPPGKIEG